MGDDPPLVAVNAEMLPVPLAANPMAVLLFVQVYEVPVPVKVTVEVIAPLHTVWSGTLFTVGIGFTVISTLAHEELKMQGDPSS